MLPSYRSLLGRPGARELLLVCALAWLAFSGYGLALILAAHHATRSYAIAGAAVAVESVGAGALAPIRGRLVDRRGAPALRWIGLSHALSGAVLTASLIEHVTAGLFIGAALVGATAPPLIGVARGRWVAVAGDGLSRSAHALNAALSDGAQIATPAAVAGIALAAGPVLPIPLLIAAAGLAAFVLSADLGLRPGGADTGEQSDARITGGLLGVLRLSPGLRALAACDLATAAWLSGLEIAVIALAGHHGPPELGALILGASALGSITVSLLTGAGKIAGTPATRYRAGALLASLMLPLTLLTTQLATLAAILFGIGGAFGLINVAFYELVDVVAPPEYSTEAFTWLTTASATGGAIGAVASSQLVGIGSKAPSLMIIAFGATAAIIALSSGSRLRVPRTRKGPTAS